MRDITVSIATTNRIEILATLTSLLTQDLKNVNALTIISLPPKNKDVLNLSIVKHILEVLKFNGVKVVIIYQKNKGIGKARALQFKNCYTKFLLTIDDDVALGRNCLTMLGEDIRKNPLVGAVMPKLLTACDVDKILGSDFIDMTPVIKLEPSVKNKILLPFYNIIRESFIETEVLYQICSIINTKLLNISEVISVLEKWNADKGYEDRWLGAYIRKSGFKVYLDPKATAYHFIVRNEHRKWNTKLNFNKEANLIHNLLDKPFIEES